MRRSDRGRKKFRLALCQALVSCKIPTRLVKVRSVESNERNAATCVQPNCPLADFAVRMAPDRAGRAIADFAANGSSFHAGDTLLIHETRGDAVIVSKTAAKSSQQDEVPRCNAPARAVARVGPQAVLLHPFVGQDSSELSAKQAEHVTLLHPVLGKPVDGWVLAASAAGAIGFLPVDYVREERAARKAHVENVTPQGASSHAGGKAAATATTATAVAPTRQAAPTWAKHSQKIRAATKLTQPDVTRQRRMAAYHTKAIKKQLERPSCLIDPRTSKLLRWIDGSTSLALMYTAVVTPPEVALLDAASSALEPLFLLNRFVDLIFVLDMLVQFRLIVEMDRTRISTQGPLWILEPRAIAINYLRGWFAPTLTPTPHAVQLALPSTREELHSSHCCLCSPCGVLQVRSRPRVYPRVGI